MPTRTVLLPSSTSDGTGTGPGGDLHDDVAHVRAVVDSLLSPVVLCGHSYGGAVITEAAAGGPAVCRLVYLAAAVPDAGESLADLAPAAAEEADGTAGAAREAVRFRADGMLDPASARDALFHDCPPARADEAIAQLAPSNPAVGTQPVRAAAWHVLPVTYVRGTADPDARAALTRVPT